MWVFCLLLGCRIAGAQEESWEHLMARFDQLQQQGNYGEAETALLSALKVAERLAPGDLRVATTLYNLGSVYRDLGRPAEAEKFYQRSLSVSEKALGADHPSLAQPLSSLITLYVENGLYAKAERLHRRYLPVLPALGVNNRDAARLLHNLAALYDAQRKYSQAEPLYRQALAEVQQRLGPEDQEAALVLNNLALLYAHTGRHTEAISHFQRALAIWEKALGSDHPNVARALTNLAGLYSFKGRQAEAEPLFKRALAVAENALGPDNPLVAKILAEYSVLLRKTRRKTEARSLEKRAQTIRASYAYQDLARHTVDASDLITVRDHRSAK